MVVAVTASRRRDVVVVLHNKNPPTPCLWQAPASTRAEEMVAALFLPCLHTSMVWTKSMDWHAGCGMPEFQNSLYFSSLALARASSIGGMRHLP